MRIVFIYYLILVCFAVAKPVKNKKWVHRQYKKNDYLRQVSRTEIIEEELKAQRENDYLTKIATEALNKYKGKIKTRLLIRDTFNVIWNRYKEVHNKSYENEEVELKRMGIFFDNLNKIKDHNAAYNDGDFSFKLGVNRFTDFTNTEFREMMKCTSWENSEMHDTFKTNNLEVEQFTEVLKRWELEPSDIANEVDWRTHGIVTQVKDQKGCAACYAFAAIGTVESYIALRYKRLINLSPQQIIDCSHTYGNCGCKGGMVLDSFSYIKDYGIESADDYPYEAKTGTKCRAKELEIVMDISKAVIIHSNETLMQYAVNYGPIATFINGEDIQFYRGGIMSNYTCNTRPTQAVIIVGYGTDKLAGDYWIVKNSWGNNWGEGGYMKLERNKHFCGIGYQAYYPTL